MACYFAPGLMEALNPREDQSHGSTEEVPGGASGASGPALGGSPCDPGCIIRDDAGSVVGVDLGLLPPCCCASSLY